MREIKFRGFPKSEYAIKKYGEKMLYNFGDAYDNDKLNDLIELEQKHFHLMQFTGLLDKHGKEIYEGDICQIWNVKGDKIVENYTGYAEMVEGCWHLVRNGERTTIFSFAIYCKRGSKQGIEIIGNIYENPELIK